jgi:hypothetical protein
MLRVTAAATIAWLICDLLLGREAQAQTVSESAWTWNCKAKWYQSCAHQQKFELPNANLVYCRHEIIEHGINGERSRQIKPYERGLDFAIDVTGSYNIINQWGGWFAFTVKVFGISRSATAEQRAEHRCEAIPGSPSLKVEQHCIGRPLDAGWAPISSAYSKFCDPRVGGDGQGRHNTYNLVDLRGYAVGSTIEICNGVDVPSGWISVRAKRGGQCGGGLTSHDTRVIRRVS